MCEGGKKKHCSRINDRISEILIANAVWNTFSSSHKKIKPVLVSLLKFAPPPSCGWTLLTRQPLIVHLLILRWDWQMKDSVLTVNLSILMWLPVQWKVERAQMLAEGGAHILSHAHKHMSSDHAGPHPAGSLQQCQLFQHNLSIWTPISHILNKKG